MTNPNKFKLLKILCKAIAISSTIAFSQNAIAQSSVDSDISIVKTEAVKLSNVDDWLVGVFSATDTITGVAGRFDWQCVYSSTGAYRVELTSANGGSQLHLLNGAGDQLRYSLNVIFRRGAIFNRVVTDDTVVNINNLSGSTSLTCADERFVGINVGFAAGVGSANFNAAPPGIYTDLMTIVVSPE